MHFMEIVGHQYQRDLLSRVCEQGIAHHVFMFHGPSHVGKRTIAEVFAKGLIEGSSPVWKVSSSKGVNHDLLWLRPPQVTDKAKKEKKISVDDVRKVRDQLYRSHYGSSRVLIVDDAQMMSVAAQNAFLKVLEEPPADTYIIFVTSNRELLLPTIVSRSMLLSFGLLDRGAMAEIPGDHQYGFGRPGLIYRMRDDEEFSCDVEASIVMLKDLRSMKIHERLLIAAELSKDSVKSMLYLEMWLQRVHSVAHEQSRYDILLLVKRIEETLSLIKNTNVNKRIALENLMIHF